MLLSKTDLKLRHQDANIWGWGNGSAVTALTALIEDRLGIPALTSGLLTTACQSSFRGN